ncbi:MAG: DNA translocase FtsK [Anaerolineae bacterium]|nr:DNA translocase FtsK [Anaerolineae bacterium]
MAQPKDKNNPKPRDPREKIDKYSVKPEFWDTLLDALPPWADEIAAIVLIIFGIVSFLSLFNVSSDASLAAAWTRTLVSLFGYGSFLVCAGIFALGVLILLPKVGIQIGLPAHRIFALEVGFIAILALLHLGMGDLEFRAIARDGQGGGTIGGAMSSLISEFFGTTTAIVFYSAVLIISLSIAAGVRRSQITSWLQRTSERLMRYSEKIAPPDKRDTSKVQNVSARRTQSLMRIRADPSHLPPSQRSLPPLGIEEEDPPAAPPPAVIEPPKRTLTPQEEALFSRPENFVDPLTAGKILKGQKSEYGWQVIERPDGRIKNYFSVANIREPKKTSKREKDLPPLEILQDLDIVLPHEDEINRNVILIENTLLEFDIDVDVVNVRIGPTVTQYALQPFREKKDDDGGMSMQRTRLNKIASLANDLALSLSAKRLRLEVPVPGHSYMGIEVPNRHPSVVALRSVYESKGYYEQLAKKKSPLLIPLGRDVAGEAVSIDLAGCPHLLIAGTTGSGKSVCIAAIASALILDNMPDMVKLVMLDPKMVELSRFNGLPHLIGPVETELDRMIEVLRWCTREMDRRYKLLEENAARNIEVYNSRLGQRRKKEQLPYIVIMIDEVGDLMMSRPVETEQTITRLAQMARAVGMHLVVATQRPSVDVITGLIKANFPSRISFAVATSVDSRVILDTVGAENLLGKGDMLYLAPDAAAARRLQGCYVSDEEVRKVVAHWRDWAAEQIAAGKWEKPFTAPWERGLTRREFLSETDPMLEDAIELVVKEREASASLIQRRLGLGYPRAARIMDLLEELGVIGEPIAGGRARRVTIEPGKDPFKVIMEKKKTPSAPKKPRPVDEDF